MLVAALSVHAQPQPLLPNGIKGLRLLTPKAEAGRLIENIWPDLEWNCAVDAPTGNETCSAHASFSKPAANPPTLNGQHLVGLSTVYRNGVLHAIYLSFSLQMDRPQVMANLVKNYTTLLGAAPTSRTPEAAGWSNATERLRLHNSPTELLAVSYLTEELRQVNMLRALAPLLRALNPAGDKNDL